MLSTCSFLRPSCRETSIRLFAPLRDTRYTLEDTGAATPVANYPLLTAGDRSGEERAAPIVTATPVASDGEFLSSEPRGDYLSLRSRHPPSDTPEKPVLGCFIRRIPRLGRRGWIG